MLRIAQLSFDAAGYKSCINRAYYAIFHAMNAIHAIDGFASRKHSGVIAEFHRKYIKTGILSEECSDIISDASEMRNDSDYQDFFIASREEAETQLKNAMVFLDILRSIYPIYTLK